MEYNVYCDESCHLENDAIQTMGLGAVWCPIDSVKNISQHIKNIKKKHGLNPNFEIKWTKISPAQQDFYFDLVNYFFKEEDLHFRALIIPKKNKLNHKRFLQDHDTWYYKMYFLLLKEILDPSSKYNIYIDIKDTKSQQKVKQLEEILCNSMYDFDKSIIKKIQQIRSHETAILQITDLLLGAMTYIHRKLNTSTVKQNLIEIIKDRSEHTLLHSTLPRENKFNVFVWNPQE